MNSFIYTAQSLPKELCVDIIELFEQSKEEQKPGIVKEGFNPTVKNTMELFIPDNNEKWDNIRTLFIKELHKHIQIYFHKLKDKYEIFLFPPSHLKSVLQQLPLSPIKADEVGDLYMQRRKQRYMSYLTFQIQRYTNNVGKYEYHHDSCFNQNKKKRILTYIWYLNDVEEGGETGFFNDQFHIKPKSGKLLIFPSEWFFPHCGKMPISNDKYIATGWIYENS